MATFEHDGIIFLTILQKKVSRNAQGFFILYNILLKSTNNLSNNFWTMQRFNCTDKF
jgi:hypothetical protein